MLLKCRAFLVVKNDFQSGYGFVELLRMTGADDWGGDTRRARYPGQRYLRRFYFSLFGNLHDSVDDREIVVLVIVLLGKYICFGTWRRIIISVSITGEEAARQGEK